MSDLKHSGVVAHDLLLAAQAVYAELEGQAAHERLQTATASLKKAIEAMRESFAPFVDEVVAIKEAIAKKEAEANAEAVQQRHDDHNAVLESKSSSGPAIPAASSPEPEDPTPSGGRVQ